MKKFKMTHIVFKTSIEFTEDNPPKWLISSVYNWWWEGYVLELVVGESIESDFQRIERIA